MRRFLAVGILSSAVSAMNVEFEGVEFGQVDDGAAFLDMDKIANEGDVQTHSDFATLASENNKKNTLAFHKWWKEGQTPKAAVLLYHPSMRHSQFPMYQRLAKAMVTLSSVPLVVYGVDFPGHGSGKGPEFVVASSDAGKSDAYAAAHHLNTVLEPNVPIVLSAWSTGAAYALSTAIKFSEEKGTKSPIKSVVLFSPVIDVHPDKKPSYMATLTMRASVGTNFEGTTSSPPPAPETLFAEKECRDEILGDPKSRPDPVVIASALSLLDTLADNQKHYKALKTPVLILAAKTDPLADVKATELVMKALQKGSQQSKIYWFEKAKTGLFCEAEPVVDDIKTKVNGFLAGQL